MGVFTTAGKNDLLGNIDGSGWYAAPFSGEPGNGGTEQTNFVSVRLALDGQLAAAASGAISTNADLDWTANGANTVDWIGIYDAATAGNLVGKDQLDNSRTLVSSDVLRIASGSLTFTLTDS